MNVSRSHGQGGLEIFIFLGGSALPTPAELSRKDIWFLPSFLSGTGSDPCGFWWVGFGVWGGNSSKLSCLGVQTLTVIKAKS